MSGAALITFTPLFYCLQNIWLPAWKADPISDCTCPRRRRNALLTKGRIFRAAFPPIKAACLIPSKLKIKGRLFRSCQPIKLRRREGPLCFHPARWTHHASSQPRRRGPGRLKGFLTSGRCHSDPGPSQESRSYSKKVLASQAPVWQRTPLNLSPHLHLDTMLSAFSPKGIATHFCARGTLPATFLACNSLSPIVREQPCRFECI